MKARVGVMAVVAVAIVWAATSCSLPVGDLGGAYSEAYGINDAGVVIGVSQTADGTTEHGFARLPDTSVVDLVPLAGQTHSWARQINEAGTIVGTSGTRAVEWDQAGHVTDLGFNGMPWDINDHGVVVGLRLVRAGEPANASHAWIYDPAVGHVVELPELAGTTASYAWGINNVGKVVGTNVVNGAGGVPVVWDLTTGTVTDLTPTTGAGQVNDINDAGTMIGTTALFAAVVWIPGSPAVVLPGRQAVALNDDGTVVGEATGKRGFRWRQDTGFVILGPAGQESSAYAINASGGVVGSVGHALDGSSVPVTARASYLFAPTS